MPLLSIGAVCFVVGLIFKLLPPKKINYIYGWRSRLAMKNKETWDEAQRYGANLLIFGGIIAVVSGYFITLLFPKMHSVAGSICAFVLLVVILILGEVHLRKVFDEEGNRKNI
ncbi:SdpI family protein [Vallitalea okinawensis]|uniref:SdpI family protein n=1 Tax=Vallitalea okinawensis TaxID=2078660 RepID=UPI000CFCF75D|nr:SdpI family protein [Vallitalea okinawensis]